MEKYKISQPLMEEITWWKHTAFKNDNSFDFGTLGGMPLDLAEWWSDENLTDKERNNRLIGLVQYVNGEDVFEIAHKPKFIVRSKKPNQDNMYTYVQLFNDDNFLVQDTDYATKIELSTSVGEKLASKFNTREEAEKFSNPLMEVVEWSEDK